MGSDPQQRPAQASTATAARVGAYIWAVVLPTALGGILVAGGTWISSRRLETHATDVQTIRAEYSALTNLRDSIALWLESTHAGVNAGAVDPAELDEVLDLAEGVLLQVETMTTSWLYETYQDELTGVVRSVGWLTAAIEARGSSRQSFGPQRLKELRAQRYVEVVAPELR